MDIIVIQPDEFYNNKYFDIELYACNKAKFESIKIYSNVYSLSTKNQKLRQKKANNPLINSASCYKKELNSLLNKINQSNLKSITKKVVQLTNVNNIEYIVKTILSTMPSDLNYIVCFTSLITILVENEEFKNCIIESIDNYVHSTIDNLNNDIDDITILFINTDYESFCLFNKKKKMMINYVRIICTLIKNNLIQSFTSTDLLDAILFVFYENYENDKHIEVLLDMLEILIMNNNSDKIIQKVKNILRLKLSVKCIYKVENLLKRIE